MKKYIKEIFLILIYLFYIKIVNIGCESENHKFKIVNKTDDINYENVTTNYSKIYLNLDDVKKSYKIHINESYINKEFQLRISTEEDIKVALNLKETFNIQKNIVKSKNFKINNKTIKLDIEKYNKKNNSLNISMQLITISQIPTKLY